MKEMLRRRLRLTYSSEEEDDVEVHPPPPGPPPPAPPPPPPPQQPQDEDDIEVQLRNSTLSLDTVTLTSPLSISPNPNPSTTEPPPIDISDEDDLMDVAHVYDDPVEVPTTGSAPPDPSSTTPTRSFQTPPGLSSGSSSVDDTSGCPIRNSLRRLGLSLRREWLVSCIQTLQGSAPGFESFDVAQKAKLCFEHFLVSDMNHSGGGVLPENVAALHLVDLPGPFVLQVDEVTNISCPLRGRYQNAPSGLKRCLKLSMTDGVQRAFGIEYRPIKDLEVLAPAGLKVVICNVNVRRGLFMLVPEALEVLGGLVTELDTARQRLVQEVNKPPRGKRTRNGVLPSLANRATRAAWPIDSGIVQENVSYNSSQGTFLQEDLRGAAFDSTTSETRASEDFAVPIGDNMQRNPSNASEGFSVPLARQHAENNPSNASEGFSETRASEDFAVPIGEDMQRNPSNASEGFSVPLARQHAENNPLSAAVINEDIDMVDEAEHPFMLTGDRETPFMYLASLSAKLAATNEKSPSVTGTIKCFLTGVKGFQYKQRTTYELQVYVDDGSLISEVLIDHSVVQKGIGCSPEEVTAALASSDRKSVSEMRGTLKQFQVFLVNFEGTMLIEINHASPLPIALEMKQGTSASDAWLLLQRLQSRMMQHPRPDPIAVSP